ncbi:hypothetical protein RD110_15895 [Rhodoferax koreense]|uniref:HTH asnC-type domain-containing protein n=2 Tax=Rhodoferax koreensis TaxID=1842727 RepID=A0A1P8K410_9BURK|nr:Lrp/AsnC family transcriptional regulator [Rhodoferax koreense]APW40732.1 hypothetical protein RD110_15895 [Rhodoferax koreense]
MPQALTLDAFDLQLLALVQADSRMPQSAMGAAVHLSTAAVNRRLKRLQKAGVIERFSAVLAPQAMGHGLSIVVEVEAENERIDLLDAMKKAFKACPQVQQCYYVTSEWDFILILCVRDMAQYTALTRQLFFEGSNVKRFRSLVVMDRVKVGLDVPV